MSGFRGRRARWLLLGVTCFVGYYSVGPVSGQEPAATLVDRLFAGTGQSPQNTDPYPSGRPAGEPRTVALGNPFGVEVQGRRIWLTTVDDQCIWITNADGQRIRRVAGNGTQGYSGDGGPALEAQFSWPHEVRVNEAGDLFIADTRNHAIRVVRRSTGMVTTLAGNGEEGFAGDGESGSAVQFRQPHSVVLDGAGGVLVADTLNHRLRRIDLETGIVTTVAGTGERKLPNSGDPASGSPLFGPRSLAVDEGSIWIALREGNSIWRIDRGDGTLQRVAGTGAKGYSGDGGPPLNATFNGPKGLTIDSQGRLLVVDTENHVVRRIDVEKGSIETVLGGASEGGRWPMKRPHGIAPLSNSGFLVADSENHRVLTGGPSNTAETPQIGRRKEGAAGGVGPSGETGANAR